MCLSHNGVGGCILYGCPASEVGVCPHGLVGARQGHPVLHSTSALPTPTYFPSLQISSSLPRPITTLPSPLHLPFFLLTPPTTDKVHRLRHYLRFWPRSKGTRAEQEVQRYPRLPSLRRISTAFFKPHQIVLAAMDGLNGFTSVNGTPTTVLAPPATITPSIEPVPPQQLTGVKRKRESKPAPMKFYAVRIGKEPGIYHTWTECLDQVRGFPKAAFKSFTTLTDAEAFLRNEQGNGGGSVGGSTGKFYGVQSGRNPGVYSSWSEVLEQITGWKGPKHKVFKTRMEAELFVAEGNQPGMANGDMMVDDMDEHIAAKKAKTSKPQKNGIKEEHSPGSLAEGGEYEPGEGPLPEGAEDNFDTGITLDQETGTARYKTASEFSAIKYQASAPVRSAPIRIYTDGSALSNGQANSIGGIGVYFGPLDKRNVSEPLTGTRQTNQRAELTAILRALEVAPRDRKIDILSDSNYAINCCTVWFQKWRQNNWLNASHKPVENKDLVVKIVDMLEERYRLNKHRVHDEDEDEDGEGAWESGPASVKFTWVKGHAKDEGNNAADQLAVSAAHAAREMGEDLVVD